MNEVSPNTENTVDATDMEIPAFLARTKEGEPGEKVFAQTAEDAGGQDTVLH
jgi:hypothetical protein